MPPRLLKPKDEASAQEGGEGGPDSKSSKRRAVSSACIPCRKRKSKCDGDVPSCSTCVAVYRTECYYDQDSDHRRKGALKRDIQSLQQQNDALDVIVASLKSLPEQDAINLLHSIRGDDSPEDIAATLQTNVRLPHSFSNQTLESEFVQHMAHPTPTSMTSEASSLTSTFSPGDSRTSSEVSHSASGSAAYSQNKWFRTPQDLELVQHLFDLYFCWVDPFYHIFARERFILDFRSGRTDHCSSLLVNAVMAIASHYSDRAATRAEPLNPATAGDQFFAEARRLLELEDKPSLTTVQALGIMSFRETSHGRDSNGYQYAGRCVRTALEMGLHLSVVGKSLRSADFEARKITFWAVFNIETICSVGLGRLSQLPRAAADVDKPSLRDRAESQTWKPYEDANLTLSPSAEQPARHISFIHCLSDLSELASDMVNTFYAPRERFTSRRLVATYGQYQDWYRNLPDCFRLENTSLPHVLVLHMYYYACVLHLFRPYIKLDLRGADLYPHNTCTFCANEISALMSALRAMYGLRRVPLPVTGLLLSASTVHLLNLPSEQAASNLSQAMHDLRSMSTNHYFAGRCVDIIRALAAKWHIRLPESMPATSPFQLGNKLSLSSPPQSAFFAPSIPRQTSSGSGAISSESKSSLNDSPFAPPPGPPPQQQQQQHQHQSSLQYDDPFATMDPCQMQSAFWLPFPLQGMPTLPLDGTEHSVLMGFGEHSAETWQHYNMPFMESAQHHAQQQQNQHQNLQAQQQQQHLHHPRQNSATVDEEVGSWNWG